MGHHYTSTFQTSHFRKRLMITKHEDGQHVSVTGTTVTVRRPGKPTEHRDLDEGELATWLRTLDIGLTAAEERQLLDRVARLATR